MIAAEALLDAFINANILIVLGYGLWFAIRSVMQHVGLKSAFETQLQLLNATFLAILCAPVAVFFVGLTQKLGFGRDININLSDMIVAHYLNGGFAMKASEFESLVLMRDHFVLKVLSFDGLVAQVAIAIVVIGATLGLARMAISVNCLWRIVRDSYAWRRFGRIRIQLSDRTLVPFSTRGLRNYYVVIPSHMLGEGDQVRVAIAHELQHIRQGDLEWELGLEALKPLFYFNPAYHAWKRQVEHLRELNCDWQVLSNGRVDVASYCKTLLSVCQKTLRKDRAFVLAVPKVTLVTADRSTLIDKKQSFLERRILSALDASRPRNQRMVFAVVVVPLVSAILFASVAIQSPGDWSHDRLMLSTVVNLDRLDEINRLSTFGRIRN